MKKLLNLFVFAALLALTFGARGVTPAHSAPDAAPPSAATNNGWWTWVDGSNTRNQSGIYGTEDVPAAANTPGAREYSTSWRDADGNLWLFGGFGYDSTGNQGNLNDLWKFNPTTGQWTWVDGSDTRGQFGTYGTEDVPAAANVPGVRNDPASWIDSSGNLWLFGGFGYDGGGNIGYLNDLWKFDPDTEQWTWVDGSDICGQFGTYGTEDVPAAANVPGARDRSASWISGGNLWLFGGDGLATAVPANHLNDLWKFDPATGQWTWVDGLNATQQSGTYGTEDVPAAANVPGAREYSASWISGGSLWLFGGLGRDSAGNLGSLNDLWKFDPVTGQWTWVDGSITMGHSGIYGTEDIPAAANVPGTRWHPASWIDASGNLWLFGGEGYDGAGGAGGFGTLNDLWKFDPATGQWTWVDGSNTWGQSGTYGTEDIPAASNVPGARRPSAFWMDASGNLWLFGGYGYDSAGNTGPLNDLWKFADPDATPPVVTVPADMIVQTTSPAGAVVTFNATATDETSPANPTVTCVPPSGSTFPIGVTTVICSATDAASNTGSASFTITVTDFVPTPIFADVPFSHWANEWVERLYQAGITGGCDNSPMLFCPNDPVTRAQMAIFILRGIHGSAYTPPAAAGTVFADVTVNSFAAAWIEQLALEGITAGCGGGNYCPNDSVTRAQMSIFLLRGEHGSAYAPPAATGSVFTDVPLGSFADAWIEQLFHEGITAGCGGNNYCPGSPVTRAEMAVFLVRTFNLP